jgi:hypothetical protein
MSGSIHFQAVHQLLYGKVFKLPEMVRIVFLIDGYDSDRARRINPAQTRIKLHHICTRRERQRSNGTMCVEREHSQRFASPAKQKSPVMLRVHGHSVIEQATLDRILTHYGIGRRVDLGYLVAAAQVDINSLAD